MLVLKGLVGLHRTVQLQLLQHYWLGHRLGLLLLNGLPWKGMEIILSFFKLHPSTAFHTVLWKILKEMGIPDHLTCLLRNLYTGQEGTVRTGQGTTDCFQIGKGVHQGCMLSPCLFNLYEEWVRNTDKSLEKVDLICQYPIILLMTISIFLQMLGQEVPFLSSFGRISLGYIHLFWEATSILLLSLERDSKFCTLR